MGRYVVATIKSWNIENYKRLRARYCDNEFVLIDEPGKLTANFVKSINPDYIFFPHWSWIIPREIYENYDCVVFHMTDLPFGRGGSPLQNLIVRGIYKTKISAIKVCADLDAGPVYMKEPINISKGNADDILKMVSDTVYGKMIPIFLNSSERLVPRLQMGEVVTFNRRTPEQSEIPEGLTQRQLYDYIRMLDGEGYPNAFRQFDKKKIYYSDAKIENDIVTAKARIIEDDVE